MINVAIASAARQIACRAILIDRSAFKIKQACASGLWAITLAYQSAVTKA